MIAGVLAIFNLVGNKVGQNQLSRGFKKRTDEAHTWEPFANGLDSGQAADSCSAKKMVNNGFDLIVFGMGSQDASASETKRNS